MALDFSLAHNSFRRDFKRPRQRERNGEADREDEDDQLDGPIRNSKKWKNLGRDLDEQPCRHHISDRDVINARRFNSARKVDGLIFRSGERERARS